MTLDGKPARTDATYCMPNDTVNLIPEERLKELERLRDDLPIKCGWYPCVIHDSALIQANNWMIAESGSVSVVTYVVALHDNLDLMLQTIRRQRTRLEELEQRVKQIEEDHEWFNTY